jgi:2'-5' RNA ligase
MQLPAGVVPSPGEEQAISHFALVAYIPDPLGRFLDDLRNELTPGCKPHAHVTVLPPRPLNYGVTETVQQIAEEIRGGSPFRIDLGDIEMFQASHVIYLGLARGSSELRQLYSLLNRGCLKYTEPFPYHPHITIAQNILAEDSERLVQIAKERWAKYQGQRSFSVTVLSFVQQVAPLIWVDVAALPLGVAVSVGR